MATEFGDRIDCAGLTPYEIGVAMPGPVRIGVFGDERTCPISKRYGVKIRYTEIS